MSLLSKTRELNTLLQNIKVLRSTLKTLLKQLVALQ